MITIITGSAGTGKTFAAMNFAKEADTLFILGDESEAILRRRAAHLGWDLSKIKFESGEDLNTLTKLEDLFEHQLSVKQVVIENTQTFQDLGFGQSQRLRDLAVKYNLHVLLTNLTRRTSREIEAALQRVDGPPTSLRYTADNHIHLDSPFDACPTGVMVKSLTFLPHQVPEELFGVKLRQEY